MSQRTWKIAAALLVFGALTTVQAAEACDTGSGGGVTINKPVTVNKTVNVYKPVTVNKSVNVYKPVTIDKSINIYKPVTIDKSINITKNIDASKNITINKSIVINKGGSASAEASAFAAAWASASASASVTNNIVIYSGYNEYITINNRIGGGGEIGAAAIGTVQASGQCEMTDATVIKAVHAVCVSPDGREFPAAHMTDETWVNSGYEGEVFRCIPGSRLRVSVGDVVQSDQGMAGAFTDGQALECGPGEALRHFKDGMLKCTPKVWVKDCTERANLRRWGSGDLFFSFRTRVCVPPKMSAAPQRELELSGMTLNGGVGEQ